MGREVRQVPPNWEHPKDDNGNYKSMFDRNYQDKMAEWITNHQLWLEGKHPDQLTGDRSECKFFAQWNGDAPDIDYYNIFYTADEATWFQLYETVSEGTPVSPPFATKEELAEYLAENGDFWYQSDQKRGGSFRTKPTLEQARSLVDTGWAMSFMASVSPSGVKVMDAYEQQDIKTSTEQTK